jgi:serine phosphatase RsbU (regulator of sigma subunit)
MGRSRTARSREVDLCSKADPTMSSSIQEMRKVSPAFRQALLRSEEKRVAAAILFLSIFEVLMVLRIFVLGSAMSRWGLLILLGLIAFELGLLRAVNRALSSGADISQVVWYLTVTLESLCPAVGIAFLTSSRLPQDYRPLATPWALAFFPFILLSVLRLSPLLCWVAGLISTVGYLGAAYLTGFRFTPGPDGFSVTHTATLYFASLIVTTGIIASGVANEIRIHIEAALREAETRHQLRQVEHELQIAKSIQQSLLPKIRPQIAGFQVSGWNRSADDTGGDFYDWKKIPDGRWVVVLADVTGHGIGPAILAALCRAYSRASFNTRDSLPTALKNINDSFAADLTPESFATFVAVVFQEGSDQVELLSAGHGPLFIYDAETRSFRYLHAQAPPLGILPEMDGAIPVTLEMKPGDIVLLITDGFFEWQDANEEEFGTERLAAVVGQFSDREPEIIIAELYDAVLKFSRGTPQKDDLTAVLIKRVPV